MKPILSLLFILVMSLSATANDSIGVKKINQQWFVLHQVEAKESLEKLARRYQSTVANIKQHNSLNGETIKIGQILQIPIGAQLYHTVRIGETLNKIARAYQLHTDSLMRWNKLSSANTLKEGQILSLVSPKSEKTSTKITQNTPADTAPASVVKVRYNNPDDNEDYHFSNTAKLVKEVGMGAMINGTRSDLKAALHRYIPVGKYVRVYNEATGTSLMVKIIGKIPNATTDDKVVIKLSESVCRQLGILNEYFPITLFYEKK